MHPTLRATAERQLGLFTSADARRAGYEHREVTRLLSSGRWVRLRRGVYLTAEDLATAEQQGRRHRLDCLAVLLALDRPSAAVSHTSAARLWKLPVDRQLDRTVRLTDATQWRRGKDFLLNRAPLPPEQVTTAGPLRVTSVARTAVDCAREWPLDSAVVALDAALLAGLTGPAELRSTAAAQRGWPRAARALRAVSLADGRAESPLETRGRLRIIGSGFPAPELQVEIRTRTRLVAVVDAWFDAVAVAVEFDGRVKYRDPWRDRSPEQVLWEEKRREDDLRDLDIRMVRITDGDLGSRWPTIEERLTRLQAGPGPAERRFTALPRVRGLRRTG